MYCKISNYYHANVFFESVHLLISSYRSQNIGRILDSISCSGKSLNKLFSSDQEVVYNNNHMFEKNMEDYVHMFTMLMIGVHVSLSSTTVDPYMCG